jgi:hypothetical protein
VAAQQDIKAPEWVFPGAQVVATKVLHGDVQQAWLSTVTRVGKGWVTLKDLDPRIALDKLESANQASGPYSSLVYRITERYSEEGQALLSEERIRRATAKLNAVFEAWQKDPRNEVIRAAIRAALDRLDAAIEKASE